MSLISLSDYKSLAAITTAANDTRLQFILDALSDEFEKQCGKKIGLQAAAVEKYDGTGRNRLHLKNFPIILVSAVSIYDGVTTYNLNISDDLFVYFNQGFIEINIESNLVGAFYKGQQNITITYDYGYDPVPKDVQIAIAESTARLFRRLDNQQAFSSKAFQGGSVVFTANDFNDLWRATVSRYKIKSSVWM